MSNKPVISFLVSTYDDPLELTVCLASLALQKIAHEVIVCDNGPLGKAKAVAQYFKVRYYKGAAANGCYKTAEEAIKLAKGEWIGFPSSDSYYMPLFSDFMLGTAKKYDCDLVYCDCVYDPRLNHRNYALLYTYPNIGHIDKTCFLMKRDLFTGFPPHASDYRDGALIEQLVVRGVRHIKAPGILAVHN